MTKITALLPMKHHSERVSGKNIKMFNGKPLFYHILQTLDNVSLINDIIINTDSEVIEEMALKVSNKVKIHKRPEEICGDFVSMNQIIENDLINSNSNIYIQTHSTNPLLKSSTIENAIQTFINHQSNIDSLFSVTKLQSRFYWNDGKAINHNPNELLRTQDLPPVFEENSNFYIFTKDSFKNANQKRIGLNPLMFEVNKIEAMDIDEPEDFILAETIHKLQIVK